MREYAGSSLTRVMDEEPLSSSRMVSTALIAAGPPPMIRCFVMGMSRDAVESRLVSLAIEDERAEPIVSPPTVALASRPMRLLEIPPGYTLCSHFNPTDKRPTPRLATVTAEYLDLVTVAVDVPGRGTEEMPGGRRGMHSAQAHVSPCERGGAFRHGERSLVLADQLHKVPPIDENVHFSGQRAVFPLDSRELDNVHLSHQIPRVT